LPVIILAVVYRIWIYQRFIAKPPLGGKEYKSTLCVDQVNRRYTYYLPADNKREASLLFVLHGANDTGNLFRKRTGYEFDKIADRENMIIVYPDGYKKSWNDCRKKARYPAKRKNLKSI